MTDLSAIAVPQIARSHKMPILMPSPLPPNRATAPVAATPTSPVGGWSDEPIKFLDPHALIAASRPRPHRLTGLPLLVIVGLSLIVFSAPSDSPLGKAIGSVGPILFLGMLIGLNIAARRGASQMAIESQAVTALDELIQLRRWQEAAERAGVTLDEWISAVLDEETGSVLRAQRTRTVHRVPVDAPREP